MIKIDDIIKRSRSINESNTQEFNLYHPKCKSLLESNVYDFGNIKYLLKHWEYIEEKQTESFKKLIDLLDEAYERDNIRDFQYIKSYIINEATPKLRDAKQTIRHIKYKTTRMKNKIAENIKKNTEDIKNVAINTRDNVANNTSKAVSTVKSNAKKSLGQKDIKEAYTEICNTLEKYYQCDRILYNTNTIQKRFNIMNMVENTDINNDASILALIDSICECVNTYDADFSTRLNTTLETCFYFLSRKNKDFNKSLVLEETVNNFICRDLSDNDIAIIKSIIESSVIFNTTDKINIDWLYNAIPFEDSKELAKPFLESYNSNITQLGYSISRISNDLTDKDVVSVLSSIRRLNDNDISLYENSLSDLINKISLLYSGDNFNDLCLNESFLLKDINNKYKDTINKYASKSSINESILITDLDIYNETFTSSIKKNAKEIVNDFKLKKLKKPTDVRTCVSKMFTKSPDQIIEGTPNFFSWVRLTYVVGATAINPILGAITLLVDQFIAMKLKRRDVDKMITVFKNERKNVSEKLKRVADEQDKKNLKEYDKYLSNGIEKLEEYRDSLLTDKEIEARDNGEEYDKNAELDFLKDDDDDFEEAVSFENLVERTNYFSKDYFTKNIKDNISIMDEDTIDVITDVACKYPQIISTSDLYSLIKEELDNTRGYTLNKYTRMSCLNSNLRKLDSLIEGDTLTSQDNTPDVFEVIIGLEDLFTEYSISKLYSNESASTNVKLLANKMRKVMQKASDIDKETSKKIDGSVNTFVSAMQRAARNDNREAIIRGSILPSASKVVKAAIIDGGVALVNPAIAVILAVGQFAISKKMKIKERQYVLDEIDIELEMCKRYLRQAEDQNDLEAQKRILQIQRNLERQKQRIQYNMKVHWKQDVPKVSKNDDY